MPSVQSYKVLIGLEVHVQLATASKMFTAAPVAAGAEPNSLVDEVVLGLPGVLPVMNRKAVEYSIRVGLALGCQIASYTKWDRKSYYYPDLPKNYQISQYDLPLCGPGQFTIALEDGKELAVRIRRAHLEEDAGKLLHEAPGGFPIDYTIVDLNRAGTPLLEIVTEPDMCSGRQVAAFGQELQKIVQFLGVSHGQMQLGQMRFEPNINLHITDNDGNVHKTAITEIKNLNSFAALQKASDYEISRQLAQFQQSGQLGRKSTYGWDDIRQITVHQRDKEEANDYRYFPDPDLPAVEVDGAWLEQIAKQVGELPAARRARFAQAFQLTDSELAQLCEHKATGDFYEQILTHGADPRRACNLLLSQGKRLSNQSGRAVWDLGINAQRFAEVAQLMAEDKIAAGSAAGIMDKLLEQDADPAQLAEQLGLLQSGDSAAVDAAVDQLIGQNPQSLIDYRNGKQAALGALVGMIMKSTKGLNPRVVKEKLIEKCRG